MFVICVMMFDLQIIVAIVVAIVTIGLCFGTSFYLVGSACPTFSYIFEVFCVVAVGIFASYFAHRSFLKLKIVRLYSTINFSSCSMK